MSSESMASTQPAAARSRVMTIPWQSVALGAVALVAAVINFVQLGGIGLGNTYYAAAVKSMSGNWHAFFFNSLDPGGFVSIDKPPVAFWLQVASVRAFGFGSISILLPQAVAGILSVLVVYRLVARTFGREAGLLAALFMALMPVAVLVDRSNLAEAPLVLTVLLSAWAVTRATESGRLRWLILGALLLGIAFNIKMLEAYLALPALILVYLLGAPLRWSRRIWHLLLAAVVLTLVSLSWITAVDLTPAAQRPYVGSSGDNSELSLALGYNGLGRLTGHAFSFLQGGTTLSKTISDLSPTNLGFTQGETGPAGIQRLVNAQLGGQTGWLLSLALLGFLAVALQRRVRLPLDQQQQALVLWGGWLLTGGAFFSVAGFFHAYYLAMIAPPVAALAGIGIASLWRSYSRPGWSGWLLPVALVVTALVQAHILSYFPDWSRWMSPLVVAGSILLALILVALRNRGAQRVALAAAGLATLTLLVAPALWVEYTIAHANGNLVPSAGPQARGDFGGRPRFGSGRPFRFLGNNGLPPARPGAAPLGGPGFVSGGPPGGFVGRGGGPGGSDEATASPALVRYLENHQGRATFLVGTLNAAAAEPFILSTGKPVMDLGGFMGADRILDPQQLAGDVSHGLVRYFLLPGFRGIPGALPARVRVYLDRNGGFNPRFPGAFGGERNANSDLVRWVSTNCTSVPSQAYGVVTASGLIGFGDRGGANQLYDCGRYAAGHKS